MNRKRYNKKSNAKNFLLLVAASLLSFSVGAGSIDENTALQIATQKMLHSSEMQSNNPLRSGNTMQLLYKSSSSDNATSQLKSTEETVFFYVFGEEEGGFVIVAGDDRITPILGYSATNSFSADNIPPNLQWWLGEYAKQIEFAIENNIEPTSVQLRSQGDCTGVEPLLKTQWNQRTPYNNEVVAKLGGNYPTGCGPTAVAQVMNYWANEGYPNQRNAKPIPAYTTRTLQISVPEISNTTNYDWNNMKNTTKEYATDIQKNAMARLMYELGAALKIDYNTGGSSSSFSDVITALSNYFNYDAGISLIKRDDLNTIGWDDILREELDAGRPVLYAGQHETFILEGHGFICDGYNCNDNTFHFNWGWGGDWDGYFVTSLLNPAPSWHYNFIRDNYILVNVKPNPNDTDIPVDIITLDETSIKLDKYGGWRQLMAIILPVYADKTITWESSDNNVATVNSKGVVTAVAKGTATITATTTNGKTATCEVSIEETENEVVTINGVTWATRNVDAPGTFAATPESAGMLYRWNQKIGWSSVDPIKNTNGGTTWDWDDERIPQGAKWEKANDPSPEGYRFPTRDEFESLCDKTKVSTKWTRQNGMGGIMCTDIITGDSLFFPASGYRSVGILWNVGNVSPEDISQEGYYWNGTDNYPLHVQKSFPIPGGFYGSFGMFIFPNRSRAISVRSVIDETFTRTPGLNITKYNLTVYPNPAKTELTIKSGELYIEKVEICTLTGAIMLVKQNITEKISVSALPKGIYFVTIKTEKTIVTEKFIVTYKK
jgi:uncharacterized protein YjdB